MVIETRYLKFKVETNIQVEQHFRGKSERMRKKEKRKEIYMKIKNAAMSLENLIDVNGNVCVCIVGARIAPYTSSSNTFDKFGRFRLYLDDFSFFERDSRSNFILREHSICQLCKWNELINFSLLFFLLIFLRSISWLIASFFSKRITMSNLV